MENVSCDTTDKMCFCVFEVLGSLQFDVKRAKLFRCLTSDLFRAVPRVVHFIRNNACWVVVHQFIVHFELLRTRGRTYGCRTCIDICNWTIGAFYDLSFISKCRLIESDPLGVNFTRINLALI